VPVIGNAVLQSSRAFNLTLTNPHDVVLGSNAAQCTITDDDDKAPPRAKLGKLAAMKSGKRPYRFTVVYTDAVAVNLDRISHGDVVVSGPDNYRQAAKLVSKTPNADGKSVVTVYQVSPPKQGWGGTSTRDYTFALQKRHIADILATGCPRRSSTS